MNKKIKKKIEDIKKNFGKGDNITKVLKGISFEIKEGEFVAIIGKSGSGKSTLMNILGALDTPTSGSYFLDGKDISKLKDKQLAVIRQKKIGFVFQSFNLLNGISALKNVMMPLIYNNDVKTSSRKEVALECLENVGFDMNRINNKPNQISGGQMQRVAIARALVNNPTMILADEPTGNLDSKTEEIVLNTFQELNRKNGVTIVIITHDDSVASRANRIIKIQDGLVIEDAPRGEGKIELRK
ncbi:MAG: ABC transporter ATP-binding protein [Patescibacteria group bacterium]